MFPRTPAEITADALTCIEAGAAIVHNHNDEPMWVPDGVHAAEPYVEAWTPIVRAHPDVLLYATQASGGPGIAIETRWAHHEALARLTPLALVDPGSVSLGGDAVYINSHADAHYGFERCAALGLAPSVSIFDPSFLRVALAAEPAGGRAHQALLRRPPALRPAADRGVAGRLPGDARGQRPAVAGGGPRRRRHRLRPRAARARARRAPARRARGLRRRAHAVQPPSWSRRPRR